MRRRLGGGEIEGEEARARGGAVLGGVGASCVGVCVWVCARSAFCAVCGLLLLRVFSLFSLLSTNSARSL